ncbi:MBL fold metallo-hydrolase [Candidatus Oleimmundimicrobium sp.]|uniref:MBL fold metallo-hydrolase n=1 Tax=Candidatus Oleimmundimicrobium sp. TaxID=3060597 RepID=UPI002721A0A7|nr:MBL fold metallo-hydrolase [Candidatus Oleimmundimicrobium sp.]MDO8885484.1 MBL fold metallo-hydrolase [Candidatus Oleimmundimicrobium sp.]
MKVTIVYDNEVYLKNMRLKPSWGFSCLIETEDKKILFDSGWNGGILTSNLEELGFYPKDLDFIIISHQHWDHIGGLNHILDASSNIEVYVPKSFSRHLKNEIKSRAKLIEVSGGREIYQDVYTTGELGATIIEQSLILNTPKGLMIITGCAHPGVESILQAASKKGKIYGLLGGLHNFNNLELLKNLNLIVPSHCTKYKDEISKAFPDSFKKGGVGRSITID